VNGFLVICKRLDLINCGHVVRICLVLSWERPTAISPIAEFLRTFAFWSENVWTTHFRTRHEL
jgi:hypothetical protein